MTRRTLLGAALLLMQGTAASISGQDSPTTVAILQPTEASAIFGEIEVVVSVSSPEPVLGVEVRVDGKTIGTRTEPPFRFRTDVGEENVEHRIEAIARGASGIEVAAVIVTPSIRIDDAVELQLQQIYLTVTRGRERVLGLERDVFDVFDEDEPQEIVTFAGGDIPFTAVLLIDSSESMRGSRLRAARAGAEAFVEGMKEHDEVKILAFSDRILASTLFEGDPNVVGVFSQLGAGGGSAIHDYFFLALREIEPRQGRRVVILLSDGEDVHSVLRMGQVLDVARRSQAQVYWVRLGAGEGRDAGLELYDSWRDPRTASGELETLRQVVGESGGRIIPIAADADIEPAFREVLAELREQYAIGYYPDPERHDGGWRSIEVRLRGARLRARTRNGYYDF